MKKKTLGHLLEIALLSVEPLCHIDIFHDLYKMSQLLSRLLINGPFSNVLIVHFYSTMSEIKKNNWGKNNLNVKPSC